MNTLLIALGLTALAAAILTVFLWLVARDGGEPEPEGATVEYAKELHDITEEADPGRASLAPDWRDLVTPPPVPELGDEPAALTVEIPAVPANAYRSHHHDDTVEIVTEAYRPLYSPAFANVMGYDRHDTARMEPIR